MFYSRASQRRIAKKLAVDRKTVAKIIDTMANNKPDMVATAPAMNDFSVGTMYRKHTMTYHPGALKYFQDHKIEAKAY